MINKKRKFFALLFVCFMLIETFLSLASSDIYADINHEYGTPGASMDEKVMDEKSDEGPSLMGLLGSFVVAIGRLIQTLVAWLVNLVATMSSNDPKALFPWADQIIFNAIPILDVNFINPAEGSLLMKDGGDYTTIGQIVRNIYFTGLSIGLSFMTIVVAVLAIKLAISSIGSQKAKYKEAIITWATALVLLFGMHYLLSFVFFMNESLVNVASKIVVSATSGDGTSFTIGGGTVEKGGVVSSMGEYFYKQATDGASGLLKIAQTRPIPAALYLIFVVQSLIFLFAYFKRFFYVIVLSLLAPYVVIYDFFTKSFSI